MLDASTRVDILNLLISLKRSGLAILFITHDLSLGNYVSDRTVILRHGAIVEMGNTAKVYQQPAASVHQEPPDRRPRTAQEVAGSAERRGERPARGGPRAHAGRTCPAAG